MVQPHLFQVADLEKELTEKKAKEEEKKQKQQAEVPYNFRTSFGFILCGVSSDRFEPFRLRRRRSPAMPRSGPQRTLRRRQPSTNRSRSQSQSSRSTRCIYRARSERTSRTPRSSTG